jgi:putative transposase
MVTQGFTATLVAATLAISRSSLYYRKKARGSRADRQYDEQIVMACGEKPAYGYRRVTWWLRRKENLLVNRKRVLRVMRERGLLVRSRRLRARRKKEWGRVEASEPNQIWQSDMTKIWAGPAVGWAYLVCVIDCCTREIVGWNLSHRCRTEDALAAVEQAVLARLPEGSRQASVTLTTDNGHTVHFFPVHRDSEPAEHHASTHGVSSPGRKQLHRTVPSKSEGRGSLDGGIPELG